MSKRDDQSDLLDESMVCYIQCNQCPARKEAWDLDGTVLYDIGWRVDPDGDVRCPTCAQKR